MIRYTRRFLDAREQWHAWIDPLDRLQVAQVERYLAERGWEAVPPDRPHTHVFREPGEVEGQPYYQFVPDDEQAADYRSRMFDLISGLAVIEGRYAGEILDDILGESTGVRRNGSTPGLLSAEAHQP